MKPIKKIKSSGMWKPKGRVWFQKNDDSGKDWDEAKDFEHTLKHAEETVGGDKHIKVEGYIYNPKKGGYRKK